jgi:hypothetical protein
MRLEYIAIPVALITLGLATMGLNGGLSGGPGNCGTWSLTCGVVAAAVLLGGTVIGSLLAIVRLEQSHWKSATGWFWLILNGVPALGLGWIALEIFVLH